MTVIPGFVIYGAPRTKKNSPVPTPAMTKDGRAFVRILPSAAYRQWFKSAMKQSLGIKAGLRQCGVELPITGLVSCCALIYRERLTGDLLGYEEALADWLQEPRENRNGKRLRDGAGILRDDAQIVSWDGSRPLKDAAAPRIEVYLCVLAERPTTREMFESEKV